MSHQVSRSNALALHLAKENGFDVVRVWFACPCVRWGQRTQRAGCETASGISFPEKLTAGFLGGKRHQDVDTIRA